MNKPNHIFSSWRILLVVLIGLFVSILLLFNAFDDVTFEAVQSGGDYEWVDGNSNGEIDLHDPSDFKYGNNGGYIKHDVWSSFEKMNFNLSAFVFLIFALVFMFGRDFFYMVRIRLLTDNQLSWRSSFFVIMMWEFASTLTPGVVGGAAVAMFILKKEHIPLGKGTAIVVITALMDNLFYLLMIPFVIIFSDGMQFLQVKGEDSLFVQAWFWVGIAVIFSVSVILFLSIFYQPNLIGRILRFIFSFPILKKWKDQAIQTGNDVELASLAFRNRPYGFWLKIYLSTFASWISRYLVINMLLAAFLSITFGQHFIILGKQLVLWLFMLVSPTPGGSGVAEFAFSELLAGFADNAFILVLIAILWRLISYFPYLFIGSLLLPRWFKRN